MPTRKHKKGPRWNFRVRSVAQNLRKAADTCKKSGGLFTREAGERREPARREPTPKMLNLNKLSDAGELKFCGCPTQAETDS
jgi:hypothetical protein